MTMNRVILCLIASLLTNANIIAATWQDNRLTPLDKITVGPWDNFEATITNDDNQIYFTRNRTQIPNIFRQDLRSNTAELFIGTEGDAKDPVLHTNGEDLAIVYYKNDAQGDICLVKLQNTAIHCITDDKTVDESPFWIDDQHLGYLSRTVATLKWDLVSYNLVSQQKQTLHQGFLSAPISSPDGQFIVFNQNSATTNEINLHLYHRPTQKVTPLARFDLSGITGFMAFSNDGQYLYFNHYLNDTNFDQIIDGNDHSVAFRIPFEQWQAATQPILPEQLTSVASNCKFPATTNAYLYLTCAFQGSLDIYRLPLTGQVPAQWNEAQLKEAQLTSRSYEVRLLILNTLRYRFKHSDAATLERLLSNHLEIGELTAANYYVKQLTSHYEQTNNQQLAAFYQTLEHLLYTRSNKQRIPVGIVTARFQRTVEQQRQQIRSGAGWQRLMSLMDGYLDYELEKFDRALSHLEQINLAESMLPMERYLTFNLYQQLLQDQQPQQLLTYYPLMFNEPSLALDAKLYYAFHYLKLLANTESDINTRIETITQQAKTATDSNVVELFNTETSSLQLANSSDKIQQKKHFKALSKALKKHKDNLLVRKTLHTRAIQILGDAEQFKYMELLSRNWLLTTHVSEMEFANVAEQYSVITMDKAYGILSTDNLAKAYSTFYSAIRQTNDLEAHYQFITLGLTPGLNKKDNLEKSYALLEKQKLLGQHKNYAAALRLIIKSEATPDTDNNAVWDKALALLQPINTRGLNPSMRDLLMAYLYHQKLRASQNGYVYDKNHFQQAHHHYMMALDLGRDNNRIIASVWQNLAWLYFEVRQYALAADMYRQRLQLPFVDLDSEVNTRWMYARALFYNHDLELAYQQADTTLDLVHQSKQFSPTPFLEKTAFYALQAKAYQQAATHYQTLLTGNHTLDQYNQTKLHFGYGYALMHLKRTQDAQRHLQQAIDMSANLSALPANTERLIAFKPERIQLLAYGLLAKLTQDPAQQVAYRTKRTQLLTNMKGKTEVFAYKEAERLSFLAKDFNHIAVAFETTTQYDQMATAMDQTLQTAIAWMTETSDDAGPVIYRTLINYLSLGLSHSKTFANRNPDQLSQTIQRVLTAFADQPYRSAISITQQSKLEILWETYRSQVLHLGKDTLANRLNAIINEKTIQDLKTSQPAALQDLQSLVSALQ